MHRIAVWNTAFLGDAVLTLPLLQSLRMRYPAARLDFYVRGGLQALFKAHPDIDNVYGFDKRGEQHGVSGMLDMGRQLSRCRYDLWISAHSSFRSGFLTLASRAAVRIGYHRSVLSRLYYTHLVERRFSELEEIERLLELLRPLGPGAVSDSPALALGEKEQASASAFFSELQVRSDGPVLGLHPGSVWATKRWPEEAFAHVGRKALDAGANVLLFAGPGEEVIAQNVRMRILGGVEKSRSAFLHDLSGKLSLPLLAAYIARLSCYLTNDSGPMHLAWVQGVPVTAIFGPTVRSLGFFPRGKNSTVFETNLACRPCGLHGPATCPLGHHQCMTRIDPEAVWQDARSKLWPGL